MSGALGTTQGEQFGTISDAGYLPGDRWLVVTGSALAFLDGTATDALRMWRVLSDGAGVRASVDVLVRAAMERPQGSVAALGSFLLAVREPAGLRVLCRDVSAVTVRTADGTAVPVAGAGLVGWAEVLVAGPRELTVGEPDAEDLLPVPGGVVRASAVRWFPAAEGMADRPAIADDASGPEADSAAPPPLPEPEPPPLPAVDPPSSPPPFVPAPTVLPPVDRAAGPRNVEDTRYDVTIGTGAAAATGGAGVPEEGDQAPGSTPKGGDVAGSATSGVDGSSATPENPVTASLTISDDGYVGSSVTAPDDSPPETAAPAPVSAPPPPISAVPAPPPGPGGPWDAAGAPGHAVAGGDHDGLTQLAEDLPIGYTPPPVGEELAPGTVLAVLCPSGHANAPHTSTCRLCGQSVSMSEPVPVQRPILARIRLSTGDLLDLDRPVVLGRAPYASRVAASELPRLVTVPSPNQDISRAHAQIRATDWQVVVADLDSTNGTTVRPPGRAPLRLRPGQEIVVEAGWSVDLGDGVNFVVEAVS